VLFDDFVGDGEVDVVLDVSEDIEDEVEAI
jgi:hypothetical protein